LSGLSFAAISRDGEHLRISDPEEALLILRHSTSHLLALAVQDLWPDTHLGIGPPTSDGFYYDFQSSHRFSEEDFPAIEARMKELRDQAIPYEPSILERDEAIAFFRRRGEDLKAELIDDRPGEKLSSFKLGALVDFCLGPHVPTTTQLGAFQLLSVAGSYWKGDEHREQLQRIYGTAFLSAAELEEHLERLEQARQRDHRKLGKELDLFTVQEQVAPGLIFWHPKGAKVRFLVEEFVRTELESRGYQFVYTPHIAKSDLWKTSGHYEYFLEHMYTLKVDEDEYVLKPMNCPGHIMIYQSGQRSYRDLPLRIAEFGTVYRYEKSGTLHGLLRVRGFTQDDAHIFCTPEQVLSEVIATLDLAEHLLRSFGFDEYKVSLSVSDPEHPEHYSGKPEDWLTAESVLVDALEQKGWDYERCEGEAAFYGPKIDIQLIDALGRSWQLSTFQFDFNLPARFDVNFVGSDSGEHNVIMIHRALLGSMERFMGILIEHYAGAFPVWLAPMQVRVIPVSERHLEYADSVTGRLATDGLRVETDGRNEKVGFKIRSAQLEKIPFMVIVGDREIEQGTISVRNRFEGDQGASTLSDFVERVQRLVESRAVKP